ncbi:MAG TPA: carboxylesterase family protein [Roseiarcus sp.]|nr:carboxylesterase family protein [Roseiarcus sp.]
MTPGTVSTTDGLLALPEPNAAGVRCFKGVPYAAPPVGPLRWRPPAPVTAWRGIRRTDRFGPNSLQGIVFDDIDPRPAGVSEDCLYLNVWSGAVGSGDLLPVMVWIHGGGFVVGSGSEPRYDGSNLAARGIVVVTLNHRLNALGFLAHPDLSAESPHRGSGNYGMLDLVAALGWVKRNIAAFGGDPKRVTIAGESAGSMAVSGLMASPLAKGLFARAIGESGGMFASPGHPILSLAEAEEAGRAFARKLGAASLEALRAAPAEDILAAAPGLGFRPIIDGYFLPRPPAQIFAAGEQSDAPLLAGWNRDEGFNFSLLHGAPDDQSYPALVRGIFGGQTAEALRFYPSGDAETDKASAKALGGDLSIVHGTWAWLEAQRTSGTAPIYRFRFDRCPLTPEGWFGSTPSAEAGAFHAGEIFYVFDNLDACPWRIAADDRALATLASAYWVNFIKSGDPNGAGLPKWPSYRDGERPFLVLDASPKVRMEHETAKHEFLARATQTRAEDTG